MPELRDARHLLEMAEHAAIDGDFSSADELLRDAARLQEAEFGPLHPDLANTLNNLAIVAEKTGRPGDAERFYRRAAAIASASLPADHPIVAESRQNLEDFCREHGLPISEVTVMPTAAPSSAQPLPPAPRRSPRPFSSVAIAAMVLMTVAAVVWRPWSRETPVEMPTTTQAREPARPVVVAPAPAEPAPPPAITQPASARPAIAPRRESEPSSGAVTLAAAELCRTFSASGARWRCDPPGDPVTPGPLVFYTRVRSSRDATIEHRWYRDDALRRAVSLTIRASASEGYRTYSRQTADDAGNWRVEVRSANGSLLHEERFVVR